MHAAARFADLPELRDLRKLFTERYGTSLEPFINKEVRIHYLTLIGRTLSACDHLIFITNLSNCFCIVR